MRRLPRRGWQTGAGTAGDRRQYGRLAGAVRTDVCGRVAGVTERADYSDPRAEMLDFLPPRARTVLDVGCSTGAFGHSLRALGRGLTTWGLEPDEDSARAAATGYDHVLASGLHGAVGDLPTGTFDAVYFNDVLEHLSEPAGALEAVAPLLSPTGVVIASIPNVRHLSVLRPLVLKGDWTYTDQGVLDRTHVRFFTRSTAERLFLDLDWTIGSVTGINRRARFESGDTPRIRRLSRLTRGRSDDLFYLQYVFVASPRARPGDGPIA